MPQRENVRNKKKIIKNSVNRNVKCRTYIDRFYTYELMNSASNEKHKLLREIIRFEVIT